MKLEFGKSYRTRNGLRATCVADNLRCKHPFICVVHCDAFDSAYYYFADGKTTSQDLDIISEWVDKPEVNWAIIPPWFGWVAMDEDGKFNAYSAKPGVYEDAGLWIAAKADSMRIHPNYEPRWTGDWKQSLVERPKV